MTQKVSCHVCSPTWEKHRQVYCSECKPIVLKIQSSVRDLVIKAGLRISKGTVCVDCKRAWALVFDHRHYAKPFDVDPVCRSCNIKRGPALDVRRLVPAWRKLFK